MTKYYIGIDGGATNIKAGIVSDKGKMLKFLTVPTQSDLGKKQVVENVVSIIDKLFSYKYKISGIGLAWPGKINIPIDLFELKKALVKKYKQTVVAANDADLFALGETFYGFGKNKQVVLGITLGTGVGSGLIIDGQIYKPNNLTPEFGHISINLKGPKCLCGNRGCIETYLGSRGLLHRLIKKHKLQAKNGKELYKLAKNNKKQAIKLWEHYGLLLGRSLVNASKAYRPDIIIIGGNISRSFSYFEKSMRHEMKKVLKNKMVAVKKSKLSNAAIIGAALYAKENIK